MNDTAHGLANCGLLGSMLRIAGGVVHRLSASTVHDTEIRPFGDP
jgi:hypothetical protein